MRVFAFVSLFTCQIAARAHKPFENLRKMGRMQKDNPHSAPHRIANAVNNRVIHIAMRGVALPVPHISLGQLFGG